MNTLYVCQIDENVLVTHDGYMQLGFYKMNISDFLTQCEIEYIEVNWIPDVFVNRYKRVNFQRVSNMASVGTKENG